MSIKANQKTYEAKNNPFKKKKIKKKKNNPFIITSSLPFDVSFWVSCGWILDP